MTLNGVSVHGLGGVLKESSGALGFADSGFCIDKKSNLWTTVPYEHTSATNQSIRRGLLADPDPQLGRFGEA